MSYKIDVRVPVEGGHKTESGHSIPATKVLFVAYAVNERDLVETMDTLKARIGDAVEFRVWIETAMLLQGDALKVELDIGREQQRTAARRLSNIELVEDSANDAQGGDNE